MGKREVKTVDMDFLLETMDQEMSHWAVSFEDLRHHQLYKTWIQQHENPEDKELFGVLNGKNNVLVSYPKPPENVLKAIAHQLGLDINEPIEEQVCKHKTFAGNIVNTVRYSGCQRKDDNWNTFVKLAMKG